MKVQYLSLILIACHTTALAQASNQTHQPISNNSQVIATQTVEVIEKVLDIPPLPHSQVLKQDNDQIFDQDQRLMSNAAQRLSFQTAEIVRQCLDLDDIQFQTIHTKTGDK